MIDIENLWRKRLGLTKPPLEYIYDRLRNKAEWTTSDNGYYNVYRPEYTIEIYPNDDDLDAEFYAYAMPNARTSYEELNIKYQTTILDSYQIVVLDGGRLQIPTPTWGFIYRFLHQLGASYVMMDMVYIINIAISTISVGLSGTDCCSSYMILKMVIIVMPLRTSKRLWYSIILTKSGWHLKRISKDTKMYYAVESARVHNLTISQLIQSKKQRYLKSG